MKKQTIILQYTYIIMTITIRKNNVMLTIKYIQHYQSKQHSMTFTATKLQG